MSIIIYLPFIYFPLISICAYLYLIDILSQTTYYSSIASVVLASDWQTNWQTNAYDWDSSTSFYDKNSRPFMTNIEFTLHYTY